MNQDLRAERDPAHLGGGGMLGGRGVPRTGDAPPRARRDSGGGEGSKVSSLQLTLDEPLSPELALVCPELAERARQLLPEPGRLAQIVRLETAARLRPLQRLMLALFVVLMTVTPLALLVLAQSPRFH
jgi:hypothetical protein